jgi:hypothetical protein
MTHAPGLTHEQVVKRLRAPATALMIIGCVQGLLCLALLAAYLFFVNQPGREHRNDAVPQALRLGQQFSSVVFVVIYAVGVLDAPLIVLGALQMMRGKYRGLGQVASILVMLPSCCCVMGLPIGVWALKTLNEPEVRAGFDARTSTRP